MIPRITAGFFNPVHPSTLQVLGEAGAAWLRGLPSAARAALPRALRKRGMRVLVVAGRSARAEDLAAWRRAGIDCLRSPRPAHDVVHRLRQSLAEQGAARTTVHGVLLRVYGQGVLLAGAAGAGKGRLALELVRRGHALVADDAVEIRRPATGVLVGHCPPPLHGYLEVRGLGVLDLRRAYGAGAVRKTQRVDLIVQLSSAGAPRLDAGARLGGRRATRRILGVALPARPLFAKPGDNPATLVEAACLDHALRGAGIASEAELADRQLREIRTANP